MHLFDKAITVFAADNPETNGFAVDIMRMLLSAHLSVQSQSNYALVPYPMRALNTNVRGVILQVEDPNNIPAQAKVLADTFSSINITVRFYITPQLPTKDNYALTIGLP